MLGFYEGFPATVHKTMRFSAIRSNRNLQRKLAETLRMLNTRVFSMEEVTDHSIPECSVSFEFGIADANSFNYLDDDETGIVLKAISKKPLQVMDFFCAVRYHRPQGEKRTPLRFDYCMIRFTFGSGLMEAQVFHERGPRYTSPEDLVNFIIGKVNEGPSKKALKEIL
jgi:hypothetical protein